MRGLRPENEQLQKRLEESQELLRAISNGEVDALVTSGPQGDQVFTLEGSDSAYRNLIEAMSEGAVTMAQDGTILYCNHRFAEMTKSPLEKVVGSSIYRFISPEDEAAFKRLLRDLGRGELSFRAVDESLLPVFITVSALPLGELQDAFSAVFTDLTEQKRSEDMIASERLARSIIEQATEAIVVCDDSGRIIRASDVASMICGCNPVQQSFDEVFDLRLTNGEPLSPVSIALQGEVLLKSEVSLHCSNGKQFQLLLNAGPLKSAGGKIIGCVVTLTDITELKLGKIELQKVNEMLSASVEENLKLLTSAQVERDHLSALINSISDEIWFADTQKKFTLENPSAVREFRLRSDEEVDVEKFAKSLEVYRPDGSPRPIEEAPPLLALQGELIKDMEEIIRTPSSGELRYRQVSSSPVKDAEGNIIGSISVVRDITERRRADVKIAQQNAIIEAINRVYEEATKCETTEDLGRACLDIIESITQSQFSFIGEIGPDGLHRDIAISYPGWELCAMFDKTGHRRQPGSFEIRGLYGRVLQNGRSLLTNDPSSHPDSIGVPEGHPQLTAFLGVPFIREGKAVGMIGAGNREGGYRNIDQEILEAMTPTILESILRKHGEEALRDSEARFRSVLDNSRDVIYRLNAQTGNYEYISPSAETVVGFSQDELMAMNLEMSLAMIHPDDLPAMQAELACLEDAGYGGLEYRQRTKNGEYRWISNRMSLIKDSAGRPLYRDGNIRDITERKRAEEELRESEATLRGILDAAKESIWLFSEDGTILMGNAIALQRLAKPAEDVIGKPFRTMMNPELAEARAKRLRQVFDSGQPQQFEDERSGIQFLHNFYPVKDSEGRVQSVVAFSSDITQRKQDEEELQKAHRELEQRVQERTAALSQTKEELECINEELRLEIDKHKQTECALIKAKEVAEVAAQAKSDFMANMSHEIRTPMNAVIGMTSILLDDADLNPEQKDFIETIRMNGDALMVIINDILDFSKMESEKTMLEEQPFDLRGNVEEALDLVSATAAEKHLNLAYSIDKDVPECIIGDPTRLRQILGNLLHNAVKFTESRRDQSIRLGTGNQRNRHT